MTINQVFLCSVELRDQLNLVNIENNKLKNVIQNQRAEISNLTISLMKLKAINYVRMNNNKKKEESYFKQIIKNDKDVLFYTGVGNMDIFKAIHNLTSPLVRKKWRGKNTGPKISRKFKKLPKLLGPKRKLCS